jgi:hypothetical protein
MTALSVHDEPDAAVDAVPAGVPGVVVVDGSGVCEAVNEVDVGNDKPGLVGASVDVTKRGGASVDASCATLIQEVRLMLTSRANIQNFFIG